MESIQVNMTAPIFTCIGNANHSNIGKSCAAQLRSCYHSCCLPTQQSTAGPDTPSSDSDSTKCCNYGDSCKTPRPNSGHNPNKLSTPYHARLDPSSSQPSMAWLLEKAWKAKSVAMKRKLQIRPSSGQVPLALKILAMKKFAAAQVLKIKLREQLPVTQKHQKSGCRMISPLLSRRLGKNTLMEVEIPARAPFPPPLV